MYTVRGFRKKSKIGIYLKVIVIVICLCFAFFLILNVNTPFTPPSYNSEPYVVAVILILPGLSVVTRPSSSTIATLSSEDDHVTLSVVPLLSLAIS